MFAKFLSWYLSKALELPSFTSGCFIFLYFFDFLTLDLAGMILAFFSYFWLSDFVGFFGCFLDFSRVGTTGCGVKGIYAIDGIRWG